MARIAYGLYAGKFLNAVSVGFVPLRWSMATARSTALDASPRGAIPSPLGERARVRWRL